MRKGLIAGLAAMLVLTGCATVRESRLNPLNWFGRSQAAPAVPGARADGRVLVDEVTFLAIERTNNGAIVRATGLPPTQGWWDGALERDLTEDRPGEIVYRFVLKPPPESLRVSTPQSREVTVAVWLSDIRLEDVRRITVSGARNARTVSRR
ncbi:MAG: hypothetical protein ACK4KW_10670 [Gemmobacter sp.]